MTNDKEQLYIIKGHFYTRKFSGVEENLRSVLEIKRVSSKSINPNFVAIMMNPGSSKPLDEGKLQNNWNTKIIKTLTEAAPDNTQKQLIAIMDEFKFDFIRVINLSDFREAKSKNFHNKLKDYKNDQSHSIFFPERSEELVSALGDKNIPIIAAWGLSHNHLALANLASDGISDRIIIGIKDDNYNLYRHPLPPNHHKQLEWLNYVKSEIRIKIEHKKCA